MKCPKCGSRNQTCFDSRANRAGTERKRSRKCLDCGFIFHTIERCIDPPQKTEKEEQP